MGGGFNRRASMQMQSAGNSPQKLRKVFSQVGQEMLTDGGRPGTASSNGGGGGGGGNNASKKIAIETGAADIKDIIDNN